VHYGQPIDAEVLVSLGARKGMSHLQETIEAMRLDLAARLD
jgi:hypothetical protein